MSNLEIFCDADWTENRWCVNKYTSRCIDMITSECYTKGKELDIMVDLSERSHKIYPYRPVWLESLDSKCLVYKLFRHWVTNIFGQMGVSF